MDVSNGVFGIFLAHFPGFIEKMVWSKKSEMKDLVKSLGEFTQKLDVVAAVIFALIQSNSNHPIVAISI